MPAPNSLVLLAHGSPDPRHRACVDRLAVQLAQLLPRIQVRAAYLQHHPPSLADALADLHSSTAAEPLTSGSDPLCGDGPGRGAPEQPALIPLLLGGGGHLQVDVPDRARFHAVDVLPPLPPDSLTGPVAGALADSGAESERIVLVPAGGRRTPPQRHFDSLRARLADRLPDQDLLLAAGPDDHGVLAGSGPETTLVPLMVAGGVLLDRAVESAGHARCLPPLGEIPRFWRALADHFVQQAAATPG